MLTATIHVNRTNYDRFESNTGGVYNSRELERLRADGFAFIVTDRTPADQGMWRLDAFADFGPRPTQPTLF